MIKYKIYLVPTESLIDLWRQIEPFIGVALEHNMGEFNSGHLRDQILAHNAELWVIAQGDKPVSAAITEIVKFPLLSTLRIITLGGKDFDKWGHQLDNAFYKFAQDNGVSFIESYGRRGMQRKLVRQYGYSPYLVGSIKAVEALPHEQEVKQSSPSNYKRNSKHETPGVSTSVP